MYLSPLHGYLMIEDRKLKTIILFTFHHAPLYWLWDHNMVRLTVITLVSAAMLICSVHRRLNITHDFGAYLGIAYCWHYFDTHAHSTYLHGQNATYTQQLSTPTRRAMLWSSTPGPSWLQNLPELERRVRQTHGVRITVTRMRIRVKHLPPTQQLDLYA